MIREEGGFYDRDPREYELRVAVIYPAPYMVAVNSLGHQILYYQLNSVEGVMAERFVLDLDGSVESGRPLSDFDLAVATIHFEGQYPVLLKMVEGFRGPLILGGPAVSANPLPSSGFATAIGLGDSEVLIPKLIESYKEGDLDRLADEGFYIPRINNRARFIRTINIKPLLRQIKVMRDGRVSNPFLLEVSRGCGWGCRFCLLGWHWRPRFDLSMSDLYLALDSAKKEGFEWIYVIGSDAAGSKALKVLLQGALERDLRVSLPSLRANLVDGEMIDLLSSLGERLLTLAPETGSERLKGLISKDVPNDVYVQIAEEMKERGMSKLKLYFIVGLPREMDADVEESARLAEKIRRIVGVKATLSIFIPKPGTPFETEPLAKEEDVRRRVSLFKRKFGDQTNVMHYGRAYMQTFLSVGGREISELLKRAYRLPYNRGAYRSAAERMGLDLDRIVYSADRPTPWWEVVDTGISREFLIRQLELSRSFVPTPGCDQACVGCMDGCPLIGAKAPL